MFLELSEILVCPACRPAQGLVVLVDEIRERRVRRGRLGCPECGLRVPIRDGEVRFDRAGGDEGGVGEGDRPVASDRPDTSLDRARLFREVDREERATRLAALLGLQEVEGYVLLGPGLAPLAPALPGPEGVELLALGPRESEAGAVTWIRGVSPGALPVFSGRIRAVALLGPGPEALKEAARSLAEGGRLVVVEPEDPDALSGLPVEVVAAEEEAAVAVRRR